MKRTENTASPGREAGGGGAVNRRELFRGLARGAALGGITLVSAGLVLRGRTLSGGQQCPRGTTPDLLPAQQASLCSGCAILAQCALPQATAARKRSEG